MGKRPSAAIAVDLSRFVTPTPVEPPPSRWQMPEVDDDADIELVAVGADLEPGTLLAAYRHGLFPMPHRRRQVAWFSPNPRGVIPLDGLHVSRSLRRSMRRYEVRLNTRFVDVVRGCADPSRDGAWIDRSIERAYTTLHELGWAHSVEVYHPDTDDLVGGLYGVGVGTMFAGESMFHRSTDASKVALVHLVDWLRARDANLLDVQWTTPHLRSLGAIDIARGEYHARLDAALRQR